MLKALVSSCTFLFAFFVPNSVLATSKLMDVQSKRTASGVETFLTFDKPTRAQSIAPEFERNFVQLVLKSTRMDAAKVIPLGESEVEKVFAYPYTPDTTRVRLILKQDNAWAKGKISLSNKSSKTVRIFIVDPQISAEKKPTGNNTPSEAALLNEVITKTKDIDIQNPDSVKEALHKTTNVSAVEKEAAHPVGVKLDPTRHFIRMAVALSLLLALFIGIAILVKKYASKLKKLPFGKKERLIQVVATHYMGHKKSISLVKITGEYMVVGVSNDGISLITKLGADVNVEKYLEDRFWGGTFEKHLKTYSKYDGAKDLNPIASNESDASDSFEPDLLPKIQPQSSIRTSIKEKLTKLKPLV